MQETIKAFCSICGAHCAGLVTLEDHKIVKWEQDKESGLHYLPCPHFKAQANKEVNESPERLRYPLKRAGAKGEGKWQRISWDEAFDTIASKLLELKEKYGPECLGAGVGEPRGLEFVWLQRLMSAWGSPNIATPHHLCGAVRYAAASATYGSGHSPDQGLDINYPPKLYIMWGNARSELTAEPRENIKEFVRKGGKFIIIDPRRLKVTDKADLWIKPRPGSDGVLAFGMLKIILEEGLYDKEFVNNWTIGLDRIQEEVKKFTLDDVERITWVPKEQILQLTRMYAELKPAVLGASGNTWSQGARNFQGQRLIQILRMIVDRRNIPGWGFSTSRPVVQMSPAKMYLLDKFPRKLDGNVAKQHKYAVRAAYIPYTSLTDGIMDDKIKAALFVQCNPLASYPNAKRVHEAFKKLELMVVVDIFMVPTAGMADIVLPAATTNECDTIGCFTGGQPFRALPRFLDPPGEARSDVMIISEIGKRLGLGEHFFDSDMETIKYILGPSNVTWDEFKNNIRFFRTKKEPKAEEGGFFTTSSGKAEIYSTRAVEVFGCDPMPTWEHINNIPPTTAEYPLLVTSHCDEEYHLTKFKHVKYLRKRKPYPEVQLSPATAEKIGANDGDWVWIESQLGRIMQKLVVDPELDPRVVMTSFGWYLPEDPTNCDQYDLVNVNVLIPDTPVETATGATDCRGIPCRVYKVQPGEVKLPELVV